MQIIETTLTSWSNPATAPGLRWQQVSDLAELVQRHGDFGNHPPYSFHDRSIQRLPTRLASAVLRLIATSAAQVMLDPAEAVSMRVSATFLVGKTHQKLALPALVALIASPGELPAELARQCGFSFDLITGSADLGALGIDRSQLGDHFERHGVPWDHASGVVNVAAL